jgi:hypothetical protein
MKKLSRALACLLAGAVCIGGVISINAQETSSKMAAILTAARSQLPNGLAPNSVQTYLDGIGAYIYGYPLLSIAMTERVSTNVEYANQQLGRAPLNQLYRAMALPVGSKFKDVVLPSTTTMYATGFFNLQKEPLILHIPAITSDRFFIVQLLDGWTNVSRQSPGSRLSSATPGDYALVGPNWNGDLPGGLAGVIHFDTDTVWQIMRVLTTGTTDDQNLVYNQIFKPLIPIPLSVFIEHGTDYTPPDDLTINPSIDMVTQPIKQVDSMDACGFFGTMSAMMMTNPPRKIDAALVPSLVRLGIYSTDPAKPVQFSCANFYQTQPSKWTALQLAVITARRILAQPPQQALTPTNWNVSLDVGDYGVRYLLRAIVAKNALGANRPQDAVYGYGLYDSGTGGKLEDHYLHGSNKYVLHFKAPTAQKAAEEIPPIDGNGFWSITMYNIDGTLVDNKVATFHALSTNGTHAREVEAHFSCPNADGSLDIYVQSTPPSDSKQLCNWLESPQTTSANNNGQFILFLRMYWPDEAILNSHWYPPGIDNTN